MVLGYKLSMKSFRIGIIIILVLVVGFIVWYSVSKNAPAPKSHTLKIGFVPWPGNGVYYVAQEKKFFAKEGINVEFVDVDDFTTGKQLLKAGKIDLFGDFTTDTVSILNDNGVKVKIVGATDLSFGADGIISTEDIKNIEDLKGRKVAFEVGSTSHFLLSYLLGQKGLTTKDLEVVDEIAPDAGAAFVAGKVDAAATWEPWLSKAKDRAGGHLLASSRNIPVIFDMPVLRAEVVVNRREDVKAMLRALFASQKWVSKHKPEETAGILAKYLKISKQDALSQMRGVRWLSYEENLEKITNGTYSIKNSVQIAGDLWLKLGLIKHKVNANDLVDTSILKDLYK